MGLLNRLLSRTVALGGFTVPEKEVLTVLKLFVYRERKGSLKWKKDMLDIISLLYHAKPELRSVRAILEEHLLTPLASELTEILRTTYEAKELGLNRKQFSDFKKPLLKELDS